VGADEPAQTVKLARGHYFDCIAELLFFFHGSS
jgi:hypothetical protein